MPLFSGYLVLAKIAIHGPKILSQKAKSYYSQN